MSMDNKNDDGLVALNSHVTEEQRAQHDAMLTPAALDAEKPLCLVPMRSDGACFDGMNAHEIYARHMQCLIQNALINAVSNVGWYDVLVSKIDHNTMRQQIDEVAKTIVNEALLGQRALPMPTAAVEYFLAYLEMEQGRCDEVMLRKRYVQPFDGLEEHLKRWGERRALLEQLHDNLLRKITQEDM